MEYVVTQTKQIAVTADNPEEAQKKVLNGEGETISSNLGAQPRPQKPQAMTLPSVPTNMRTGQPV